MRISSWEGGMTEVCLEGEIFVKFAGINFLRGKFVGNLTASMTKRKPSSARIKGLCTEEDPRGSGSD